MFKGALAITCLTYLAHGRRVQGRHDAESRTAPTPAHSIAVVHYSEQLHDTRNPLKSFAKLLLESSPAAAFNPSGIGAGPAVGSAIHHGSAIPRDASEGKGCLEDRRIPVIMSTAVKTLLDKDVMSIASKLRRDKKVGVILLNLGGPETLDDVRPFLYNLFSDPEILRLPVPDLQKPLAWLISTLRSKKSQEAYRSIGGGSPLRRITEEQAGELQSKLRQRGIDATTYVAMRYWHPFTEAAVEDLKADGVEEVVVLPLYPHFSISTTGSSFRELSRLQKADPKLQQLPISCVRSWYDHPGYVRAMAQLIADQIRASDVPTAAHVFFSAHGVPKSYVEKAGDPYQQEIEACVALIMDKLDELLGYSNPHTLAYQSRVGPVEWLKPYSEDALEELGRAKTRDLVVVPISFVSEHIETLEEIDMEYRKLATEAGVENFRRVRALDTYPPFIEGLADIVTDCLEGEKISTDEAADPRFKLHPQEWTRSKVK
mmetsp:Transcript_128626/g.222938  ORF Transcript_128626/g.222938 Transcript_128626/m.222938 type:complete len:487 (+) Transcript_128626:66-1526(+)